MKKGGFEKELRLAAVQIMENWSDSLRRQKETAPLTFSASFEAGMGDVLSLRKESRTEKNRIWNRSVKVACAVLILLGIVLFGSRLFSGKTELLSGFVPGYIPSGWKLAEEKSNKSEHSFTYTGEGPGDSFTIRCRQSVQSSAPMDFSQDQRQHRQIRMEQALIDCLLPDDFNGEKDYFWTDAEGELCWQLTSVLSHEENLKIIRGIIAPP